MKKDYSILRNAMNKQFPFCSTAIDVTIKLIQDGVDELFAINTMANHIHWGIRDKYINSFQENLREFNTPNSLMTSRAVVFERLKKVAK